MRTETHGRGALLAGNFNVVPDARDGFPELRTFPHQHVLNRNDFVEKFLSRKEGQSTKSLNGVDVWRQMHADERRYTYFQGVGNEEVVAIGLAT